MPQTQAAHNVTTRERGPRGSVQRGATITASVVGPRDVQAYRVPKIGRVVDITVTRERPARVEHGDFELEVATERWSWSQPLFELLGVAPSVQPTTDLLVAIKHADDRAITRQVLSEALVNRRSFHYKTRIVRCDGQLRMVQAAGVMALARDGRPLALIGTVDALSDWDMPVFEVPSSGEINEGDLGVALLAGVSQAYVYAFRQHAPTVARASRRILGDGTQVEDVVQSVFEALWRHPERFDPCRGSLAAYLQIQARSRSIDLLRSESARTERVLRCVREANVASTIEGDALPATLSRADLFRALDALPATERRAIELAYFSEMSYRMVAVYLGLPEGTVKARIRSGLAHLRRLLLTEEQSISRVIAD